MTRGRKRKSAAEHEANGNPSRRSIRPEPEFPKAVGCPPPDYLDEEAVAEWHRLMPYFERAGVMTECDLTTFAAYCVHYSRWREAGLKLRECGAIYTSSSGAVQVSPWDLMQRQHGVLMHKFASEFGLTPATRSKIVALGKGDEQDEFEKDFGV